jgi:5-methylcytosine-specific restriction protein A
VKLCGAEAQFVRSDDRPYLEVHHVRQVADGGPDVIENAVALCPNWHRALHYAADRNDLANDVYKKVVVLRKRTNEAFVTDAKK